MARASLEIVSNQGTELPKPSIEDLDLEALPARLDDQTLDMVKAISAAPITPLPPCDERHFNQCLRIMLAVLPKRSADEIAGELFVAAYHRKLAGKSNDEISFLADKAMERCHWFPTIAECLEILGDFRRNDEMIHRELDQRRQAAVIVKRETDARMDETMQVRAMKRQELTQEEVDALPEHLVSLGISCRSLRRDDEGKLRPWFLKPGEEPEF